MIGAGLSLSGHHYQLRHPPRHCPGQRCELAHCAPLTLTLHQCRAWGPGTAFRKHDHCPSNADLSVDGLVE